MTGHQNERLFEEWRAAIRSIQTRLLGPIQQRADGSDLAQDALMQLMQQEGELQPVNRAYAVKLAMGHAWKIRRFHNRECRSVDREVKLNGQVVTNVTPESVLEKKEQLAWVAEQISNLNEDEQRVIHAHLFCDLTFPAIAEKLGKTARVWRYTYMQAIERISAEVSAVYP